MSLCIIQKSEESALLREPLSDDRWHRILHGLGEKLSALEQHQIHSIALHIKGNIHWLDAAMARYCDLTCAWCADPCCQGNRVFYNRADLLYLLALGDGPPPGQTRRTPFEECRYLSPNGCRLPRIHRPYVCVWYFCDAQMGIFQQESAAFQRKFISVLQDTRNSRIRLESLFEGQYPACGAGG